VGGALRRLCLAEFAPIAKNAPVQDWAGAFFVTSAGLFSQKEVTFNSSLKNWPAIAQRAKVTTAFSLNILILLFVSILSPLPRCSADASSGGAAREGIDLLQRYSTKLTVGDTRPEQARAWEFAQDDIFGVTQFRMEVGKEMRLDVGPADIGIGHCADGAVWAVLIPRAGGTLSRGTNQEIIAHVWLRFHPKEITRLFPPETVVSHATNLLAEVRVIANAKIGSSWQSSGRVTIPQPKDLTVDVDTKEGPRRFFVVDTEAQTAEYIPAFENRAVPLPPPVTPELATATFDQLWKAFDQNYAMFVLRPELDWSRLREQYRPKAVSAKSTYEFAEVCADMLKNLRDLHVWFTVAGSGIPVFNRPRSANANPQAYRKILGGLNRTGPVVWAITTNDIGFIAIPAWSDANLPADCGEVLEKMRNTRGLIVDVRLNGGGSEPLAKEFAGRFLEKEFVYAYDQIRNGPSHTNLTAQIERELGPLGPWRYDRPVVLLIGQKCMSSCESFVGMMTGDPQVTTMGDHTAGSSGNPDIVHLPLDLTVSVPQWIDYLPDGTVLDEHGFQPQIPFHPAPGAFEGERDDLLTAALARLSQSPLPDRPIAGPVFDRSTVGLPDHSKGVTEEARDTLRPRVVSVSPTNDAAAVDAVTELHLRFDRPMDPLALKLDFESGGILDCEFPKYDSNKYEFTIPVHLAPGALQQIVVNRPFGTDAHLGETRKEFPRDGFQSTDHRLAGEYVWRFHTRPLRPSAQSQPAKVIALSPAPGNSVPIRTFLEIQFDQPMAAPAESSPYLLSNSDAEDLRMVSRVEYDAAKNSFRIALLLPPKQKVAFTLTGFRSATGVPASPIKLEYQVTGEELATADREKMESDAGELKLLKLLGTMKQNRAQVTSLEERVQTLMLFQKDGVFFRLQSQSAAFKWQKPEQVYVDATGTMLLCADFQMGSDGGNWWWHDESIYETNFVIYPKKEIQKTDIAVGDPFGLTRKTPSEAAAQRELKFDGLSRIGDIDYFQVEGWHLGSMSKYAPFASVIQWQIDPKNYLPAQITVFDSECVSRLRFFYDSIDEPLPAEDFALPKRNWQFPAAAEPLGAGYTNRFIDLSDGSDGNMRIQYGKKGPKGTADGGFIMDGY